MSKYILQGIAVTKIIKHQIIIKPSNFSLKAGEIVGFIGPNGAGKTSIIKMMLGLWPITRGKININGFSISQNYLQAIKRVGVFIDQQDLYPYLSGYDNLKLAAKYLNQTSKLAKTIALFELGPFINKKVKTYSLGMKQKLGIAKALLGDINLLILDEPTNGLDPAGIRDLRNILLKLKTQRISVIIASHNLPELATICNRLWFINQGQILLNQEINNNCKHYRFCFQKPINSKIFLGLATMINRKELIVTREKLNKFIALVGTEQLVIKDIKTEQLELENYYFQMLDQELL